MAEDEERIPENKRRKEGDKEDIDLAALIEEALKE